MTQVFLGEVEGKTIKFFGMSSGCLMFVFTDETFSLLDVSTIGMDDMSPEEFYRTTGERWLHEQGIMECLKK